MVARRRREAIVKLKIMLKIKLKTMLKILEFIQICYFKQQSSILRCFSRLKFEKSLFSKTFFSFIVRIKMIDHTDEKDQIKYFAQN